MKKFENNEGSENIKIIKANERKYDEEVIADLSNIGNIDNLNGFGKQLRNIGEITEEELKMKVKEFEVGGSEFSSKSAKDYTTQKIVPLSAEVIQALPSDMVQVFPNFTGCKFIGGKTYSFIKGHGIAVIKDVERVLLNSQKLMFTQ